MKKIPSECLKRASFRVENRPKKTSILLPSWENVQKGKITPSFKKRQNLRNEIRSIGIRTGRGSVSTAKDKIIWVGKDNPARVEEGNFKKRKQMVLYGHSRGINDPRVFLEQSQKTFFIFIGEILSDLKLGFRIVVIIQVGYIQGNEEGQ